MIDYKKGFIGLSRKLKKSEKENLKLLNALKIIRYRLFDISLFLGFGNDIEKAKDKCESATKIALEVLNGRD